MPCGRLTEKLATSTNNLLCGRRDLSVPTFGRDEISSRCLRHRDGNPHALWALNRKTSYVHEQSLVRKAGLEPACLVGATPSRWCVCQFRHFRRSTSLKIPAGTQEVTWDAQQRTQTLSLKALQYTESTRFLQVSFLKSRLCCGNQQFSAAEGHPPSIRRRILQMLGVKKLS